MIEYMPLFAETFGYTPAEFRAMGWGDFQMLKSYIEAKERAQRAQQSRGHGGR